MSYGRNFGFLIHPSGGQRHARYSVASLTPNGAPVVATNSVDTNGRVIVSVANGEQARPMSGQGGLAAFEAGPDAFNGLDPVLYNYSDITAAPAGKALNVIFGAQEAKIRLTNTVQTTFLHGTTPPNPYPGRTMVAGLSATPTVAVGNFLTPQTNPSDTVGYWVVTATAANAWLIVTKVDPVRDEVECTINF